MRNKHDCKEHDGISPKSQSGIVVAAKTVSGIGIGMRTGPKFAEPFKVCESLAIGSQQIQKTKVFPLTNIPFADTFIAAATTKLFNETLTFNDTFTAKPTKVSEDSVLSADDAAFTFGHGGFGELSFGGPVP